MLPRINRLPAKTSLTKYQITRTPLFTVKYAKNALPYNRFGFVVSKRIAKKAVNRNRTKRLVRSCIEDMFADMSQGNDVLFVIHSDMESIQRETICPHVRQAMQNMLK